MMRLRLRLPETEVEGAGRPEQCPYAGCEGRYFSCHQQRCAKRVSDPDHERVTVKRYKYLSCQRTFRV